MSLTSSTQFTSAFVVPFSMALCCCHYLYNFPRTKKSSSHWKSWRKPQIVHPTMEIVCYDKNVFVVCSLLHIWHRIWLFQMSWQPWQQGWCTWTWCSKPVSYRLICSLGRADASLATEISNLTILGSWFHQLRTCFPGLKLPRNVAMFL